MGNIRSVWKIPKIASVEYAAQVHQATALVGSHAPSWVRITVHESVATKTNIKAKNSLIT